MKPGVVTAILLMFLLGPAFAQTSMFEQFTYQGRLLQNSQNADGTFAMTFTLFDDDSAGHQVGTPFPDDVTVSNGAFSEVLSYPRAFTGNQLWLEITVAGQKLSPRQPITAAPTALFALNGAVAIDYHAILPQPTATPVLLNGVGDFALLAACTKDADTGDVTLQISASSARTYDIRLVSTAQTNDTGTVSTTPINNTGTTGLQGVLTHTSTSGNYRRIWIAPLVLHANGQPAYSASAELYAAVDARAASAGCIVQGTLIGGG
jgi:hypothetical protein